MVGQGQIADHEQGVERIGARIGRGSDAHAAVRDDLAKLLGDATAYEPAQASLIGNVRDLPAIAEKVPVHFQRRFLELVKETYPIEYRDLGFTDVADAAFERLWAADEITWADIRAVCAETGADERSSSKIPVDILRRR